jgi:Raf kinase inhibitor-like YbhB/YbcL family protein
MSRQRNPVFLTSLVLAAATSVLLSGCAVAQKQTPVFTLASSDVAAGSTIALKHVLNGFGCTGQNISPELHWTNPPAGTLSYSLQVYDPDAPTGSGFWHWGVYNIPASVTQLAQGAGNSAATLPAGAYAGQNDFLDTGATGGNNNYGGPCPPTGDKPHRYVFTLYALGVADAAATAGIPKTGTAAVHGFALNKGLVDGGAIKGKATFTATFGR